MKHTIEFTEDNLQAFTILWLGFINSEYSPAGRDEIRLAGKLLDKFEWVGTRKEDLSPYTRSR